MLAFPTTNCLNQTEDDTKLISFVKIFFAFFIIESISKGGQCPKPKVVH